MPALQGAWLTLDPFDDALPRFLRYFIAAIEDKFPQSCTAVRVLLRENPDPTVEEVADTLSNALAQLSSSCVCVVDDLHVVSDPAIHAFLARLLESMPPSFHLVLSTRVDPPLPLNHWRAKGQLNEIRQQELSFTREESATFLTQNLAEAPNHELVTVLHNYTEGWAVGLRLAALAARGHRDHHAFVADVAANSSRYIVDYLRDDVLEHQPEAIKHFLVCTSLLNRFSAALCAAVMEIDEGLAQQHLATINRSNLFLIELSAPSYWYRYHHQFQSMLLSKLHEWYDRATIETFYRRAAAWLAAKGEILEALGYLKAIGDSEAAAAMLERERTTFLNTNRYVELLDALALIPVQMINQRPFLMTTLAVLQNWRMERTKCLATIEQAEQWVPSVRRSVAARDASDCSA